MCYISIHEQGYSMGHSNAYRAQAAIGALSEEQCSRVDAFVVSMRQRRVQSGECPEHTESFMRTVQVHNMTHYSLRVRVHPYAANPLEPSVSNFISTGIPELVGPGAVRYDPLALGAGRQLPAGSGDATFCIFAHGGATLVLEAVERRFNAEGAYEPVTLGGSRISYRFPITLGDGSQQIAVERDRTEAQLETDPRPALFAQVRSLSIELATAEREIHRLSGDISVSREETARERELRRSAERTIEEQITLLRRLRHDVRLSREENARLRRRLSDAVERTRSMIPRSVVDAIVAQRVSEAEYRWAMQTFSRSVVRGSASPGFCRALLGAGVSAVPGLFLSLVGGPSGFLASFALDVIAGIAGEALSVIVRPVINAICG